MKVTPILVGGAAATVFVWLVETVAHVQVPAEVASAFATVLAAVVHKLRLA